MKQLVISVFLMTAFVHVGLAQNVGIGTNSPHASAQLDVFSDSKGVLVPRVSLSNTSVAAPVVSPVEGLFVFNTNASIAGAAAAGKGFYYWTGISWVKLISSTEGWSLTGNSFTDTAINFIGTTDNRSLMFRVGNQPAGRIELTSDNLFLGLNAGQSNRSVSAGLGENNTFLGSGAGRNNAFGSSNTYVGASAGSDDRNSFQNTMVGSNAGQTISGGNSNSILGFAAGGSGNGSENTLLGSYSGLRLGTDGTAGALGNVAIGYLSGRYLLNGAGNVTIGRGAGLGNSLNGVGNYNIYIGDSSGILSNNAQSNVAIGRRSGRNINIGSKNVLVGDSAGAQLTTGSGNVFVGDGARGSSATISNAAAIGNRAFVSVNNALVLGSVAGVNGATAGIDVGIGTTAPQYRLHVVTNDAANFGYREGIVVENTATGANNTGEAAISFKNAGPEGTGINQWIVGLNQNRNLAFAYGSDFSQGSTNMVIDSTGQVGIGVISPTFQLQLSQNSAAKPGSSAWTVSSDERLKKDMKPFEDGLEMLQKINPIWFTYTGAENHPQEQFVGATAQAIQQIAPYMVTTLKEHSEVGDKLLGVDYGPLQFIMINAIKEQQKIIHQQKLTIESQQQALKKLDERLKKLEKQDDN